MIMPDMVTTLMMFPAVVSPNDTTDAIACILFLVAVFWSCSGFKQKTTNGKHHHSETKQTNAICRFYRHIRAAFTKKIACTQEFILSTEKANNP
jgi:hypothetical protein